MDREKPGCQDAVLFQEHTKGIAKGTIATPLYRIRIFFSLFALAKRHCESICGRFSTASIASHNMAMDSFIHLHHGDNLESPLGPIQ